MSDMNIRGPGGPYGPSFEPNAESGKESEPVDSWCQDKYEKLEHALSETSVTKSAPIAYSQGDTLHAAQSLQKEPSGMKMDWSRAAENLRKLAGSQSAAAPAILKKLGNPLEGGNHLAVNASLALALAESGAGATSSGKVIDPHTAARVRLLNIVEGEDHTKVKKLFGDVHGSDNDNKI